MNLPLTVIRWPSRHVLEHSHYAACRPFVPDIRYTSTVEVVIAEPASELSMSSRYISDACSRTKLTDYRSCRTVTAAYSFSQLANGTTALQYCTTTTCIGQHDLFARFQCTQTAKRALGYLFGMRRETSISAQLYVLRQTLLLMFASFCCAQIIVFHTLPSWSKMTFLVSSEHLLSKRFW